MLHFPLLCDDTSSIPAIPDIPCQELKSERLNTEAQRKKLNRQYAKDAKKKFGSSLRPLRSLWFNAFLCALALALLSFANR
jgi:hypothetical protein